jgi:flagellar basal body-associated protein FliL
MNIIIIINVVVVVVAIVVVGIMMVNSINNDLNTIVEMNPMTDRERQREGLQE